MAWNIARGRDAAGVHWRSDGFSGLLLGQALAIRILKDLKTEYWENFAGFQFDDVHRYHGDHLGWMLAGTLVALLRSDRHLAW